MKIKKSSVYQLSMKKALPIVKIGRLVRFRKEDLGSFVLRNQIEQGEPFELPVI
ncbi:MAG TPA: hypothetical protein ACFYD6_01000 [Candidatus Brocadiia bacterium]